MKVNHKTFIEILLTKALRLKLIYIQNTFQLLGIFWAHQTNSIGFYL